MNEPISARDMCAERIAELEHLRDKLRPQPSAQVQRIAELEALLREWQYLAGKRTCICGRWLHTDLKPEPWIDPVPCLHCRTRGALVPGSRTISS